MDTDDANAIALFVLVAAPSLFTLWWTADAALVLGEDVFLVALLQTVAIGAYMAYQQRAAMG